MNGLTIKDVVNILKDISLNHKFIKMFNEGDVYEFMNNGEKEYGIINFTIDTVERVNDNIMQINANIIYIDRLLEDNGNKLDIWTTGTNIIQQILNELNKKNVMVVENYMFNTYIEESFQDLCAGVYAAVNLQFVNNVNVC